MKKYFLLLSVLFCLSVNAQVNESGSFVVGGRIITNTYVGVDAVIKRTSDTFRVIMMVCDTTRTKYVFCQYGYEVFKFVPLHWEDFDRQVDSHWERDCYLDDRFKRLSKNTIIWDSKRLN